MNEVLRRFSRTRTFDTLAVAPLILFYAFAVAGLLIENAPAFLQSWEEEKTASGW